MTMYKSKKLLRCRLLVFLVLILPAGVLLSQSSTNYILTKSVVDQAGAPSQSTNHKLVDAIGQPSPLGTATSANYKEASGFFDVKETVIPWTYKTTNNNATVVLPTVANPNIDGSSLGTGDFVGVFTPDGLCCGYAQWQGQNLAITVWGDDDQTPAIDGFKTGESIKYRVYQISTQKELTSVLVGYSQGGTGLYSVNGYLVLNKFDVFIDRTLTLSFDQGWNMFAINVNPLVPDIANVMSPIVSKITIVKDDQGKNYIPEYGINTIGNINFKEGYQAYLTQATLLDVKGQPVDPTTPISLPAGWSMISYLPTVPIEPQRALATINDNLIIAKDGKGHQYIPEYGINTIGTMKEGQGYWVYLKAADVLVYPPSMGDMMMVNKVSGIEQILTQTEHFLVSLNSSENATVVIPAAILPKYSDNMQLEIGDEIGVFNKQGLCCGATVWNSANVAITVWGDNSQTADTIDGFQADDTLRLRVWNQKNDVEHFAEGTFKAGSLPIYKSNGFSILDKLVAKRRIPEHFHFLASTGKSASVKIPHMVKPKYSDGSLLKAGDEIAVFRKDGLCCGATVWEGIYTSIKAWSDCTATPIIDGFQVGDTIRYHVWQRDPLVLDSSTEHYAEVVYQEEGHPKVYEHSGISIMKSLVADLNTTTFVAENENASPPVDFKLLQNYPNPFNSETRIEYQIPFLSEVNLCIFDMRGQLVRELINGAANAGSHQVVWNGKNESGQMIASGLYFCRIEVTTKSKEHKTNIEVKKMIFMK